MRNFYLSAILMVASGFAISAKAQFATMGPWDPQGVPSYLMSPGDVISQSLLDQLDASLPESYPVPLYHPEYLQQPLTDMKLLQAGDVWITFVSEGATFLNALGYYTYDLNNPPATPPAHSNITVIYPNTSLPGSGGWLNRGDKVYLGHYPANTGIGFVLMANGFDQPTSTVTPGIGMYYSNPSFNPEVDPLLKRHHVFLYDTTTKHIILGFEDKNRENGTSDHDFNDVLFYLTATPDNAFDTTGIPHLSTPSDSTGSGNNGGLESESLGQIVSKWRYDRIKNDVSAKIDYSKTPDFAPHSPTLGAKKAGGLTLEDIVPETLEAGDIKKLTSPIDLLNLTNAKEVIAVDYINNNKAKAVILGLKTEGKAYSHTKSICDRFRGGKLIDVKDITLQGFHFTRFTLLQSDGTIEYAMAFVIGKKAGRNFYTLQTNWLISSYQQDETIYNIQLWGTKPHFATKLAIDIINKLQGDMPVQQLNNNELPSAYMMEGRRSKDQLQVFINNTGANANAYLEFEERPNELSGTGMISKNISLLPGKNNLVSLQIKDGYEYAGKLYVNNHLVDEFYMADGNWGLDYEKAMTDLVQYKTVNEPGRIYPDDEYPAYRSIVLKADTRDYISVYKSLKAGFEDVDLSAYKSLKFSAKGSGKVSITLVSSTIQKFAEQFTTELELSETEKEYIISLEDFASKAYGADVDLTKIKSVVFSFTAPGGVLRSVNFSVSNLAFSAQDVVSNRSLQSKVVRVYPNPAGRVFQCSFVSDQDRKVVIRITDLSGKTLHTQEVNAIRGTNTVSVTLPSYVPKSLMLVNIAADVKYDAARILVQ